MAVRIIAVGRLRAGPEKELFEHYAKRLPWPLEVHEIVEQQGRSGTDRRRREARLLAKALPREGRVVVLDERGRSLASDAFAACLSAWRDAGNPSLSFVIGGASGLDEEVRRRADLVLSLGPMTWPHLLVRGLLAEQLYRAHTIQTGHPYHRAG